VAFLLVGYGRAGQRGQIARGKIAASGPYPRPGLAFGKPITSP